MVNTESCGCIPRQHCRCATIHYESFIFKINFGTWGNNFEVSCTTWGRSDRDGRNLIKKIKDHFQKPSHQVVTVEEFCQYLGLQPEAVVKQLR